jgi:quercetin dioxygenase-like cupin family protein
VIVHDVSIDTVDATELTVIDEATRRLHPGDMVTIPNGRWHRNDAPSGVTILHLTPTEGNPHSWQRPWTT